MNKIKRNTLMYIFIKYYDKIRVLLTFGGSLWEK